MKLQFAFGNPRRKKKKAGRKKATKSKSVAKRKKTKKTKALKSKSSINRKRTVSKKRTSKKRTRKNPEAAFIRKNGKVIGREYSPLTKREADQLVGLVEQANQQYQSAAPASKSKAAARKKLASLKSKAVKQLGARASFVKTIERYLEEGAKVDRFEVQKKEKTGMAKKRRKKKKAASSTKRRKKRVVRKASAGSKKTKRKVSRKSTKRRKKKVSAASVSKVRKTRKKSSRKKASSKRRKARRVTHSHSANTRHFKKGSSFKFKKKVGRGKNKMTVSGRVKVNPYRRNPMKNIGAQMKTYLGIDGQEMTALGLGGFAVPVLNGLAGKFAPTVVSKINEFVGPQATGSVLPIIGAIILNAAAEHGVKSGQAHKGLKLAGEGLAAAGIIGLAISISQTYVTPALGMSGMGIMPQMGDVRFTPTMRGMGDVRFTPKAMNGMGDVRFTPKAMNGMGEGADFGSADYGGNGGYTQSHKFSRADFGADFSSDSEADFLGEDGDLLSSSMN